MNESVHFANDKLITPSNPSGGDVKVVLVGDSGGGNLCAAAALRALRLGIRSPAGVNLIYPCLNFVRYCERVCDFEGKHRLYRKCENMPYRCMRIPSGH